MTIARAIASLALLAMPARAHRLDEYLQATLVSLDKNWVEAQMTLTPGVAVYRFLISAIDTDGDGIISEPEQCAYAAQVLRDVSLQIDGHRATPRLVSKQFPTNNEMKEGRGEIQLNFSADLPPGGGARKITLENNHQTRISAYQVNVLVPHDPDIQIATQTRNYTQSLYQLDYRQSGVPASPPSSTLLAGFPVLLWIAGLALAARLVYLWHVSGSTNPAPRIAPGAVPFPRARPRRSA